MLLARRAAAALAALALSATPALALPWTWSYAGPGITASGTFTTVDTPDAFGFYQITAITGARNGVAITGLQPTGTSIPGNEPFLVDNLVSLGPQQLTGDGFGFSLFDGNYANTFFASFLPTPGYIEVFSAPPFISGASNFGPEDSESEIRFTAALVRAPIPAPGPLAVLGIGLLGLAAIRGSPPSR